MTTQLLLAWIGCSESSAPAKCRTTSSTIRCMHRGIRRGLQETDSPGYRWSMFSEIVHDHPGTTMRWCDDQSDIGFGLDLILDGIEGRRLASRG